MTYEVCVIDDSIPASKCEHIDEVKKVTSHQLKLLLEGGYAWDETAVRDLVEKLLSDERALTTAGFVQPEFYLAAVEDEGYRPDIIVFDWDYPAGAKAASKALLAILERTFVVVCVYSREDQKAAIERSLEGDEFAPYRRHLHVLMKEEADSQERLIVKAKEMYDGSFSFRFSRLLRRATLLALDQVMVELGKHDIDLVVKLLLAQDEAAETDLKAMVVGKLKHHLVENEELLKAIKADGSMAHINARSLLSFLAERFTDVVNSGSVDLAGVSADVPASSESKSTSRELWSYRLYYQPSDDLVRRGDIVDAPSGKHFLVCTADCDLAGFWRKSLGYLTTIPIYDLVADVEHLKNVLLLTNAESQIPSIAGSANVSSLTELKVDRFPEGPLLLPFVRRPDALHSYIAFPKEITSTPVAPPPLAAGESPGARARLHLSYQHWTDHKRVATLAESFAGPVVQHCLDTIGGCGVPDYSGITKSAVKDELVKALRGAAGT